MGYIFVDKSEDGGEKMRTLMRTQMRGGESRPVNYRKDYEQGYREGYKHGWEDHENENVGYRRGRDEQGRFV